MKILGITGILIGIAADGQKYRPFPAGGGLAFDPRSRRVRFSVLARDMVRNLCDLGRTWFQFAAMVFVIGSYYFAAGMRKHKLSSISRDAVKSSTETRATLKSVEF